MAIIYVDSGAGGLNDGTSWTDAYVLLASATGDAGLAAGDFIYVSHTHAETGAAKTFNVVAASDPETWQSPIRILSVNSADDSLTVGASVQTTTAGADILIADGNAYWYGITIDSIDDINFSNETYCRHVMEQCTLKLRGVSSADVISLGGNAPEGGFFCWLDCTVNLSGQVGQAIRPQGDANRLVWDGGTCTTNVSYLFKTLNAKSDLTVRNVDLSVLTGSAIDIDSGSAHVVRLILERCVVHASFTLMDGDPEQPGTVAEMLHCQAGTDADPAYQTERRDQVGSTVTDTARYRTGGASDGERTNPVSWSMTSTANAVELYYPTESLPIDAWTDGDASTAHTYRIYIASGATLQDDEIWVDLTGPNSASTNSKGERLTSRIAPLATPANHTTDGSSTWTGADVGTKQQIDITYTPDKPGQVTARVYLGKASERVSIDPYIYIDP